MSTQTVPTMPEYMTVPRAAQTCTISDDLIYKLFNNKQLTKYRIGRRILVKVSELRALIEASAAR
jgi:excisionase family DNA binding protein